MSFFCLFPYHAFANSWVFSYFYFCRILVYYISWFTIGILKASIIGLPYLGLFTYTGLFPYISLFILLVYSLILSYNIPPCILYSHWYKKKYISSSIYTLFLRFSYKSINPKPNDLWWFELHMKFLKQIWRYTLIKKILFVFGYFYNSDIECIVY